LAKICSISGCNNKHNAKGFCYNHYRYWKRYGNPLQRADPDETRKKISEAGKGRKPSDETRKKISESKKGKPRPDLVGKEFSKETRKKISEAHKGKKFSDEHRANLSQSMKGRSSSRNGVILSEESKKKISKANKGNPSPMKGKKHTTEAKQKMSEFAKGRKDSEETKKKKSIAHNRPETKRKNSEAHMGKKHTEKSKQKMSISQNKPETLQKNRDRRAKQVFPKEDTKPEKIVQIILKKHEINFEKHSNFKLKSGKNHQADILIEPNRVIEVFGDYWHFNPKKYDGQSIQKMRKKEIKVKEVWQEDKDIINGMQEQGYKVLVVWESELKDELEKTTKKILKFTKL
jgi:G:T-mismatch repair DNA endonuclease (very short patch repair protein)